MYKILFKNFVFNLMLISEKVETLTIWKNFLFRAFFCEMGLS